MGQDWGGPIALGIAVRAPDSIRGIVLGSTFAWRVRGLTRLIARVLRLELIQRWMVDGEGFIERVMALARTKLTRDELDHYQLVAATPALRRASSVLPRELIDADHWLAELELAVQERLSAVPALLIHAKKDAFSGSSVRRLARLLPRNTLLTLASAGHFFQEDAPVEVAAAIRELFGPTITAAITGPPAFDEGSAGSCRLTRAPS
jgi:haloalkane dehalogenase